MPFRYNDLAPFPSGFATFPIGLRSLLGLAGLTGLLAACGFDSRVEGRWKLEPGALEQKDLSRHGVAPALALSLRSSTFVVDDGVVYLGAQHQDAAIAKYTIDNVRDDCADVQIETASDGSQRSSQTNSVQVCLDGDQLTVRHTVKDRSLSATLRRSD